MIKPIVDSKSKFIAGLYVALAMIMTTSLYFSLAALTSNLNSTVTIEQVQVSPETDSAFGTDFMDGAQSARDFLLLQHGYLLRPIFGLMAGLLSTLILVFFFLVLHTI